MDDGIATVEYMARRSMEFDTVVAAAFRRALGLGGAPVARRRAEAVAVFTGDEVYGCMAECFANERHVRL